jgi:hypothetical protein
MLSSDRLRLACVSWHVNVLPKAELLEGRMPKARIANNEEWDKTGLFNTEDGR